MDKKIGIVTHYYPNIGVGIVKLDEKLDVGTTVCFKGASTDFNQTISQMQFEHKDIESANKGQEIGVKVDEKVREGDDVFLA